MSDETMKDTQTAEVPGRQQERRLALLFPGQGAQTVGMMRELFEASPIARATFEEADEVLGFPLSKLVFEGPEADLNLTENTQPALLAASIAVWRVLEPKLAELGVEPAFAAGHSLGEYSAHVAAGTFSFADALRTVRVRGQLMQSAVPPGEGSMAAILGLDYDTVNDICAAVSDELTAPPPENPGDPAEQTAAAREALADPENAASTPSEAASRVSAVVAPANINSPKQIVISGQTHAVAVASERCKAAGAKRAVTLAVSAPFHCALMQPAQEGLASQLEAVAFHDPAFPVCVNVDARFVRRGAESRDCLVRQVTGAVRWVECMELLKSSGATIFLEIGPGKVLAGLNRQIDRELVTASVSELASMDEALALFR